MKSEHRIAAKPPRTPAAPFVDVSSGRRSERGDRALAIGADQSALAVKVTASAPAPRQLKQDRRRRDLLEAFVTEGQPFWDAIHRTLPVSAPDFDLIALSGKDHHNREWFNLFCGLLFHLDDGRKVPVEGIARIVAALFFATLLALHGISPPGFDLIAWNQTAGRARRRRFMWLWAWLYCRTIPNRNTNSAPTYRASYEVAKKLLPGAARDWELDRDAMMHLMQRIRRRFAAGNPALKRH